MLYYILIPIVALPLIGYLRSSVDERLIEPAGYMDITSILEKWYKKDSWIAHFTPILGIFLYVFNFFMWMVYGFTSIIELIGFIFSKIWWVLRWICYEVLHPTVFALVKVLWHYVVVMAWKFFRFTISLLSESYKKENIRFSFKKLLQFTFISTAVFVVFLLTKHIISLVLALFVIFYLFQYTVFISIAHFRQKKYPASNVKVSLKLSLLWLTMAAASTALLVAMRNFADLPIITGVNFFLIQLLLPIAVVFGIAFLATSFYLPAFLSENKGEDTDVMDFLKAMCVRLPKLIVARPFKLFGMGLVSILPFVFLLILNAAVREFTPPSIKNWTRYSVDMYQHIPSTVKNQKSIKFITLERDSLAMERDSIENMYDDYILDLQAKKTKVNAWKAEIEDKKIHALQREVYVGEEQSFSIPALDSCANLEWTIVRANNNALVKRELVAMPADSTSLLINHEWVVPGSYKVRVRSRANCIHQIDESIFVEVVEKPEELDLMALREDDEFVVSRETADLTIELIDLQLEEIAKSKTDKLQALDNTDNIYLANIKSFKRSSLRHILWLFTKIIALFALALIATTFLSVVWTYFLVFEYELYSFEQEGSHYYQNLLTDMKAKNTNQPLLGIFVLLVLLVLLVVLFYSDTLISDVIFVIKRYF